MPGSCLIERPVDPVGSASLPSLTCDGYILVIVLLTVFFFSVTLKMLLFCLSLLMDSGFIEEKNRNLIYMWITNPHRGQSSALSKRTERSFQSGLKVRSALPFGSCSGLNAYRAGFIWAVRNCPLHFLFRLLLPTRISLACHGSL